MIDDRVAIFRGLLTKSAIKSRQLSSSNWRTFYSGCVN